ncbi:hypothetical protein NDU88_007844 [Pleurodeles waltl]|uniref:Uncharacterized protein n=1 Tax=Pleurodeles waltl TaxID=8319 RepID=A0AAV7LWV7_PLEWA|nr:hypothetical protein NDU88_007844 [Pleurodeles waltl]
MDTLIPIDVVVPSCVLFRERDTTDTLIPIDMVVPSCVLCREGDTTDTLIPIDVAVPSCVLCREGDTTDTLIPIDVLVPSCVLCSLCASSPTLSRTCPGSRWRLQSSQATAPASRCLETRISRLFPTRLLQRMLALHLSASLGPAGCTFVALQVISSRRREPHPGMKMTAFVGAVLGSQSN